MSAIGRRGWWVLALVAALLVAFGVGDVLVGVMADPAITRTLSGRSPVEIQASEPTAFRLYDFATRGAGLNLLFLGILLLAVVAIPYRAGQRWAWRVAWFLPAWAAVIPLQFLAFGPAAGEPPAPPMISGPIVAVLAAAALVLDRRRFGGSSAVPSAEPEASGSLG